MNIKQKMTDITARVLRLIHGTATDKVTFISFGGQSYSDNPRAISEKLHEVAPEIRIQWIMSQKSSNIPSYVKTIDKNNNLQYLRSVATTGVLVDNSRLPYMAKGKKQFFIQTWHGDKAFKKVLYDSTFSEHKIVTPEAIEGYCDLAVAGSDYGERQYRSAFRYKGRILMEGTPRNDCLVNPDEKRILQIKKNIGIPSDTKILLYAPTLRREYSKNGKKQVIQEIDLGKTVEKLKEATGSKWVCAVRAHPAMKGLTGYESTDEILDFSTYEDMADLLLISDMLITDYSSCAGDFAVTGRPIILYQPDIQAYLESDRTFYFEMSDSPYWIAETQEQVDTMIMQLTPEKAEKNCHDILRFYGDHETGHAAESAVKEILAWIGNKTDGEKR